MLTAFCWALQFYASVKSANPSVAAGNVLQLANTWEAFQLHDSIMAISVEVRQCMHADASDMDCYALHRALHEVDVRCLLSLSAGLVKHTL